MFFDIWKEEVIEKAKKEAKALRKKNKKREKQNIRKEIQAGELVKIETRNVRFFINTKNWGGGKGGALTNYVDKILSNIDHLTTPC